MHCRKCGVEVTSGEYFCDHCGAFLDERDEKYIKTNKWRHTYYLATLAWYRIMTVFGIVCFIALAVWLFMFENHYLQTWYIVSLFAVTAPFFVSLGIYRHKKENLIWMIEQWRIRHNIPLREYSRTNSKYKRTAGTENESAVRPS